MTLTQSPRLDRVIRKPVEYHENRSACFICGEPASWHDCGAAGYSRDGAEIGICVHQACREILAYKLMTATDGTARPEEFEYWSGLDKDTFRADNTVA